MELKSVIALIAGILLSIFMTIFYFVNLVDVEAGHELVEVRQPYIFGQDGVNHVPYPTGRHFIWPSSSTFSYDVRPMKAVERFDDITANDNVPIDFTATFVLIQVPGQSPTVHENFGPGWYKTKVMDKLRTLTRNEARERSSVDLRTKRAVIEDFQEKVMASGNTFLEESSIPFRIQQVQVGRVIPPEELLKEAARTAAQKQRKKTQDAREKAESARKAAETAAAVADKAYMNEIGMTPDQYLRSRALDLQAEQLEILKAAGENAKFNVYMMSGGASNPQPVISVD